MPKSVSHDEAETWLRASNIQLSLDVAHEFPGVPAVDTRNVMVGLPSTVTQAASFALRVVEWLPTERTRLLWITKWHQYPLVQKTFFETVRRGCGIADGVSVAPGHLLGPNEDRKSEIEYSSLQHSILSGLILLMMSYDWRGFLAAEGCSDQVVIGDANIFFCSADNSRIAAASDLAKIYGLSLLFDRQV